MCKHLCAPLAELERLLDTIGATHRRASRPGPSRGRSARGGTSTTTPAGTLPARSSTCQIGSKPSQKL
ncbi:hypothetical protein FMEAI12_5590015 [Parafrankia sp. Ea1.12]|nr:hypothetical protein FMEAI12_5590015 [Parafrankia sp. Ea1.12]